MFQEVHRESSALVGSGPQLDSVPALNSLSRYIDGCPDLRTPVADHADGGHEVRVPTDQDLMITPVMECVIEHVNGDVYIGSLFFRP